MLAAAFWALLAALCLAIWLLLRVRRKCPLPTYVLTSMVLVAGAAVFALWQPVYFFHYSGPLNSSGAPTSAIVIAFAIVAFVCAVPAFQVWRFFQPLVALVAAWYFILSRSWIS